MKLSEITKVLNGNQTGADIEFNSVSIDTRTMQAGDLFVAIQGENFDGHDYLEQAKQNGACAAIVSKDINIDLPLIKVADTKKALAELAAWHRQQCNPKVIAITGSNGKTTTKEIVMSILSQTAPVLASQGNFNNDIGVPLTLLKLTTEHKYAVIEMGANHPGEIAYLAELAMPDVALVTQVAPAHLEGFGSIDGVAKAKGEIFSTLSEQGTAIFNADDDYYSYFKVMTESNNQLTFALHAYAEVMAHTIQLNPEGKTEFILWLEGKEVFIELPLLGLHNVLNALAAAAVAYALEIPLEYIKAGLEAMKPYPGRLAPLTGKNGCRLIDDSYNANLVSVKAAIDVLANYPGETILVLGDLRELGEEGPEHHRMLGEYASEQGIDRLYTLGTLTRETAAAFGDEAQCFDDWKALSEELSKALTPEITVLVKGSQSMGMKRVVDFISITYNTDLDT